MQPHGLGCFVTKYVDGQTTRSMVVWGPHDYGGMLLHRGLPGCRWQPGISRDSRPDRGREYERKFL